MWMKTSYSHVLIGEVWWIADLIPNCIIVCQSVKKWAGTCCRALNSTVLGLAVCANLFLCWILLLLDVELRLQQASRTSGVYSTERAMKHSYSLTHLRSYVDCIASIFINCWPRDPDLTWQCACGTVFVIFVLDTYIYIYIVFAIIMCRFCRSP